MKKQRLFRRGFAFFAGERGLVVACLVLSVFCSILPLVLPVLEGMVLGNIKSSINPIPIASWLMAIGVLLQILLFVSDYVAQCLAGKVERNIKLDIVEALSKIKIKSYTESGVFTTRINTDADIVSSRYADIFLNFAKIFSNICFIVFIIVSSAWLGLYTVVGLAIVLVVEFFRYGIFKKSRQKIFAQEEIADSVTNEMVLGASESKRFNQSEKQYRRPRLEYEKLRKIRLGENIKLTALTYCENVLSAILSLGFIILSVMLVSEDKLSLSTFFIVYIYRTYAETFLKDIVNIRTKINEARVSTKRIADVIDGNRKYLHETFGDIEVKKVKGELVAKNIKFGYLNKKQLIAGVSLVVQPNELVGIVGKSGVGKSTLLAVLSGELAATEGEILIDGKNLNQLTRESRLRSVMLVSAKPFFFSESVKENLLRANHDATFEMIVDACREVDVHDAITSRPKGYGEEMQSREIGFSTGERQKLALARALLSTCKILLIDEPVMGMDDDSKKSVVRAIKRISQKRSVVVATHDKSVADVCDRVFELKNGKLHEIKKAQSFD